MTDEPSQTPASDAAPIDVEFEPKQPDPPKQSKSGGPGWMSFSLLGLIALGSLGLHSLTLSRLLDPNSSAAVSVADESEALSQIDDLKQKIAALETANTRTSDETSRLSSRVTALSPSVNTLRTDVSQLSGTIEALSENFETLSVPAPTSPPSEDNGQAPPPPVAAIDTGLANKLASLEAQFQTLLEQNANTIAAPAEVTGDALKTFQTDLTALRTETDALKLQVEAIETTQAAQVSASQTDARAEAAIALSSIELAARRGRPFMTHIAPLRSAYPDVPAIETLSELSSDPVPTPAQLERELQSLKSSALDAEATSRGESASWMRAVFGDGVTLRQEGEVTLNQAFDEASLALKSGQINDALNSLKGPAGPVETILADWKTKARKRLELEQALEALRLTMIAKAPK